MKNKIYSLITAILITQFAFAGKPEAKTNRNVSATGFIENKGQIIDQNNNPNPAVKYLYHGNGLNVQLKTNGFSYDTYTTERTPKKKTEGSFQMPDKFKTPDEDITYHFHRIDVNLIGANQNPTIVNAGASEAYYNYFTAGTPEGGVSNVHSFQQVTYQNIYPNIDLQFICDAEKGFKYNFIVHPGGDYTQIKLQYNGANGIKLQNGEILIPTSNGNVTENIPLSYLQENNAEVKVNYKSTNQNEFSFQVNGNYNSVNTLVIDPTPNLVWGTYYGGTGSDVEQGIVLDAGNNVYITGFTISNLSIATAGAYQTTYGGGGADAFVAKFNSTGSSLIWGTYYGGPGIEVGYGITLDVSNNVYITGRTTSYVSIATGGAYQTTNGGGTNDVFVAKFNSTGSSLLWGTYYGGTGADYGYGIILDASNNVYITGYTTSTLSIATGGAYQTTFGGGTIDVFVAKFNSTGSSLLWGTYYGGTGDDYAYGIDLDASNNVYITGNTSSTLSIATVGAYQTTNGGGNAFIAKFNSTGSSLLWGTYYGGSGGEAANGIVLDASNNVYITGATASTLSIATGGAYQTTFVGNPCDAFVAKFNSTGSSLLWGTYYGGTGADQGYGITLDASNNVYISGNTSSTLSIATGGAYQSTYGGGTSDVFVAKFNSTGSSLLWGTYYGGTGDDFTWFAGITLDANNNVYITGYTTSTLSIATGGAYQTTYGGGTNDVFVAKFMGCAAAPPQPGAINGSISNCVGNVNTYTIALVAGATSYTWSLPGAWTGSSTTNTISATTGTASGNISVSAVNSCGTSPPQTLSVTVNPQPTISIATTNTLLCVGETATLTANGALSYTFNPGGAGTNIVVSPNVTTNYTITGTDANGCTNSTAFTQSVSLCIGINQLANSVSELNIYPNPFNNKITIVASVAKQTVLIYNSLGQIIFSSVIEAEKTEIDLSSFSSGVYCLKIQSNSFQKVLKIIKE